MQLPSSLRTLQASHRPLPGFPTLDQIATYATVRAAMPQAIVSVTPPTSPAGDIVVQPERDWRDYRPSALWTVLSMASAGASAFHGYRRNQSVGWAVAWGAAGAVFPVITPAIAVAQGFGERAKK